ncbi:hypothetical protein GCM10027565_00950 [Bordetella tumulicola]
MRKVDYQHPLKNMWCPHSAGFMRWEKSFYVYHWLPLYLLIFKRVLECNSTYLLNVLPFYGNHQSVQ